MLSWRTGTGGERQGAAHRAEWKRDGGSVSLFLAVTFAGLALLAGLIVDAGGVLHANAHASDLAGKAARVGAQEIDLASLRAGQPRLDHAAAEAAAHDYLVKHGLRGAVTATDDTVTVIVRWHVDFNLLAALRPDGATVTQARTAVPTFGP
jgi:hypothetical protein